MWLPVRVVTMESRIHHVALRVSDLDTALEFYDDHLDLHVDEISRQQFEAGERPSVALFTGDREIHLLPTDEAIETGTDHVCLEFRATPVGRDAVEIDAREHLESFLSQLREAGYEIESDVPTDRPGVADRWSAYVRDPDGRLVELTLG